MIQKLLLNIQRMWMTIIKILKNRIQIKNENLDLIVFNDMIADMLSYKKT